MIQGGQAIGKDALQKRIAELEEEEKRRKKWRSQALRTARLKQKDTSSSLREGTAYVDTSTKRLALNALGIKPITYVGSTGVVGIASLSEIEQQWRNEEQKSQWKNVTHDK